MNNLSKNLRHTLVSKTTQLFSIAIVLFFTLSSCSSDSAAASDATTKLLGKMVDVATNGSSTTTSFTYNANKIVSIDGPSKHMSFNYNNDLITKIVTLDDATQSQTVVTYTYAEGNLVKTTLSENYVINYVHNTDGTITYEKYTTDSNNNEVLVNKGTLYFQNGNLTRDERILEITVAEVSKRITTYQYDNKINPLNNILGLSKLLDNSNVISKNNVTRIEEEFRKEYINSEQVTSSMVLYVVANQYDTDGYPSIITSEKKFFGWPIDNHIKTELYYN
jgi:hypothetical protein